MTRNFLSLFFCLLLFSSVFGSQLFETGIINGTDQATKYADALKQTLSYGDDIAKQTAKIVANSSINWSDGGIRGLARIRASNVEGASRLFQNVERWKDVEGIDKFVENVGGQLHSPNEFAGWVFHSDAVVEFEAFGHKLVGIETSRSGKMFDALFKPLTADKLAGVEITRIDVIEGTHSFGRLEGNTILPALEAKSLGEIDEFWLVLKQQKIADDVLNKWKKWGVDLIVFMEG